MLFYEKNLSLTLSVDESLEATSHAAIFMRVMLDIKDKREIASNYGRKSLKPVSKDVIVHSLSSGKVEMFLCAPCHAFTPHVVEVLWFKFKLRGNLCSSTEWK